MIKNILLSLIFILMESKVLEASNVDSVNGTTRLKDLVHVVIIVYSHSDIIYSAHIFVYTAKIKLIKSLS